MTHTSIDIVPTTSVPGTASPEMTEVYRLLEPGRAYTVEELTKLSGLHQEAVRTALYRLRTGRKVVLVDDSSHHLTYARGTMQSPTHRRN